MNPQRGPKSSYFEPREQEPLEDRIDKNIVRSIP